MPTSQRLRAVQMAQAAAAIEAQARVWASADVLTPRRWVRRECERLAQDSPQEWPRLLGPAEEWLLWREAAQEAARDHPFLDTAPLADSLQHASERAADYGVRLRPAAADSEAALLFEARRVFEARCRDLNAAGATALIPRLQRSRPAHELLLRGFDAVPPWLAALAAVPASHGGPEAEPPAARVRGVRTPDANSQMEAIAAWCHERLSAEADARLLVMLPGPPGSIERLAALIRERLDPGAALAPGRASRALIGIEGGEPLGLLPLPSQALLTLGVLAGGSIELGLIRRWLTAPFWSSPAAAPRAPGTVAE